MIGRPSLLMMTAASAALATVANAVGLAEPDAVPSRLGVAIAEDVTARNQAATRRGRTLDLREQAVRAAEVRLKANVDARAGATPTAGQPASVAPGAAGSGGAGSGAAAAAGAADQFDDLARIYQAMKPVSAALVMQQLDLDVQMRVAQRMRERSTALILAAMTPKNAATLTMALARRQAYARPAATARTR